MITALAVIARPPASSSLVRPSRKVVGALAVVAIVLVACGDDDRPRSSAQSTTATLLPAPPAGDPARGRELVATFQCNRCHDGTGLAAAPRDQHCVQCHIEIHEGRFEAAPELIATWRSHIVSLPAVPSLEAAGARFRREWIASFLREPHDLRPGLLATMPRLPIDDAQALAIATHLVPEPSRTPAPRPTDADLAAGRRLLDTKGCGTCHAFSGVPRLVASPIGVDLDPTRLARAMLLAPDLRHTRDRMQPARLAAWIRDPRAIKRDTPMTIIPLTEREAEQIAGYILHADLAAEPARTVPERLALLDRRVTYAEVYERVFRKTCRHCHADPDFAIGDGGPGNTGGFGFAPRRLNLATYIGAQSGYLGDDGRRRSVFAAGPDGVPRLVAALLARHSEEAGRPVDGIRGMPLGLPAVPIEDIQLLDTWIAQGRPE